MCLLFNSHATRNEATKIERGDECCDDRIYLEEEAGVIAIVCRYGLYKFGCACISFAGSQ